MLFGKRRIHMVRVIRHVLFDEHFGHVFIVTPIRVDGPTHRVSEAYGLFFFSASRDTFFAIGSKASGYCYSLVSTDLTVRLSLAIKLSV